MSIYPPLQAFLDSNRGTTIEQLFALEDSIRYAKRLNGKTLQDINTALTKRQLDRIASELEISQYTWKSKTELRQLIIKKYNSIFYSDKIQAQEILTDADELNIQADLMLGSPSVLTTNDEHDLKDYITDWDIAFEEDKHGNDVPTQSSVWDFFRPTLTVLYKKKYRCLKIYKGRYYQFNDSKWNIIDSLEEPSKDLCNVVFNNMRLLDRNMMTLFVYIDRNDKFKQWLRKKVQKHLQNIVKMFSQQKHDYVDLRVSKKVKY